LASRVRVRIQDYLDSNFAQPTFNLCLVVSSLTCRNRHCAAIAAVLSPRERGCGPPRITHTFTFTGLPVRTLFASASMIAMVFAASVSVTVLGFCPFFTQSRKYSISRS